jgi:hypothetical protein
MDGPFKGVGFNSAFNPAVYSAALSEMPEPELIKEGKALASICNPLPQFKHLVNQEWVEKLKLCRVEYRKRHPKE